MSKNYEGCYFCDVTNPHAVEGHHLVPQRFNGTDQPENMVDLCGSCHNKIEELYDDAFYERLGVAVDEIENENIHVDSGEQVDASDSLDRKIPPTSEHILVEKTEEREHHPKADDGMHSTVQTADALHGREERGQRLPGAKVIWPKGYRLHCGYCHTVYSEDEHSDMARHLRVRHGIENPYEEVDTTFGEKPDGIDLPTQEQ